jgi:hypothetical protein
MLKYDPAVLGGISGVGNAGLAMDDGGLWTPYAATSMDTVAKSASLAGLMTFANFALTQFNTSPVVSAKIYLQGPFIADSMSTTLGASGFIPLKQPYNSPPWNYAGTEQVDHVPPGIVDWVLIEVRTGNPSSPPMTMVARRAAFVKQNGALVDLDGISPVSIPSLSPGSYYIVVRHRNHLAIMSANATDISKVSSQYIFTAAQGSAYSTDPVLHPAMKDLGGGRYGMFTGDANCDGQITKSDGDAWLANSGSAATGYVQTDFNCDGQNTTRDFNPWLLNSKRGVATQVP